MTSNRPRLIDQYSSIPPRLSGETCIFGLSLGIKEQKGLKELKEVFNFVLKPC